MVRRVLPWQRRLIPRCFWQLHYRHCIVDGPGDESWWSTTALLAVTPGTVASAANSAFQDCNLLPHFYIPSTATGAALNVAVERVK